MTKDGVLSIWLGTSVPTPEAIDAFYASQGIDEEVLADGKDENVFNERGLELEEVLLTMSFASSTIDAIVAAARRRRVEVPRWVSILHDYAHEPPRSRAASPGDPVFVGVFDDLMEE